MELTPNSNTDKSSPSQSRSEHHQTNAKDKDPGRRISYVRRNAITPELHHLEPIWQVRRKMSNHKSVVPNHIQ